MSEKLTPVTRVMCVEIEIIDGVICLDNFKFIDTAFIMHINIDIDRGPVAARPVASAAR